MTREHGAGDQPSSAEFATLDTSLLHTTNQTAQAGRIRYSTMNDGPRAGEPFSDKSLQCPVKVVKNETSGVWHLIGSRGCGREPTGETVEGTWAEIRDRVVRDAGDQCSNCRWPN